MSAKERSRAGWEEFYRRVPIKDVPWEQGRPSQELVKLIEAGGVEQGPALDVCCGSANNAIYLAEHGFDCYGLDISATAIGYAEEKASAVGVSCHFIIGDAAHLTYPDDFFTLVFDRGCFHSIPKAEREDFIKGLHRVMKRGAKYQMVCFSASDPKAHAHSFSEEDIRSYFEPQFKILSLTEIPGQADDEAHLFLSVLMQKA